MSVEPISAFSDNYIWLLRSNKSNLVTLIDPGDANSVLKKCLSEGLQVNNILITHHHSDHIGGISRLKAEFPDATVYGPATENISLVDTKLKEGDKVELKALGESYTVMDVPGHTAGHIAYFGEGNLFCGDTLFACGCGRVFDGTMQQLCHSLEKISQLPDETLIYCAHEYTLDNIGFAKWVEPENQALLSREVTDFEKIDNDQPTIPSTLGLEKQTNPFLRFNQPLIRKIAEQKAGRPLPTNCEVFTALRTWKDTEYD